MLCWIPSVVGGIMTDLRSAEEALKLAILVEQADGARKTGQSLGFALINYGRLFVRDYWTLFSIAREMDCEIGELVPKNDHADKRAKWDELVRHSEIVLTWVRSLPGPMRSVAEARGKGESWRKVQSRSPGRLSWSIKDDYRFALEMIVRNAPDSVSFLASAENFIVVKRRERA